MSKAMIPAYITSFLLKVIFKNNLLVNIFHFQASTIFALFWYFSVRETHAYMIGYLEAHYYMVNIIIDFQKIMFRLTQSTEVYP